MFATTLTLLALLSAPGPGEPAPRRDTPAGLEVAPWDALWVDRCQERLVAAGLEAGAYYFSPHNRLQSRPLRGYETIYCHTPQAVVWTRGPTGALYYGHTMFNCAMSLAMTRFERIAQEEARRIFDTARDNPITIITHMGTYNCRRLRAKPERQSQHSFGNAIDLAGFYIHGVGEITILRHWNARYSSQRRASEFLHTVMERLRAEQVFTNILDPAWDEAHANHVHMDLAPLSDGLPSAALAVTRALPVTAAWSPAASDEARTCRETH